ncbi:cytochrome c biogenesis protein [Roseofilum sp. BLCC_M91]|uniref:Cytochrome c biogenesis protein CcsB n=1 Tax=Roseofilum halophilum BLCC-M91 TaxID=3022259 RepID=A0ABT7BKE8_9CYAN|nr:cytochrome c biogenesis protein [Roseofilum halophilum]MDJ1179667.1 cytochrome c biogenesis protein [Roseofilum halophilum BLCC-M91]
MTSDQNASAPLPFHPLQWWKKQVLPTLADLRLAIILLLAIALFSISGTVIEQGQSLEFYQTNYPEDPALFGFLSWKVLLTIGLDHVYSTWWFLALLVWFGSSLTACTFTRQLPTLKAANRWSYYKTPKQFQNLALSTQLNQGSNDRLEPILKQYGYRVFREGDMLYARKGIIGRIGPIVVHASMLIILAGSILGSMTGFIAQEIIPSGDTFQIKNIIEAGPFAQSQVPKDWSVRVNRFWIDYSPEGRIEQFYSDLSVLDNQGEEVKREEIHVNQPLRYRGVTLYQADWAIASVKVRLNNSPIFKIPMAQLPIQTEGRIWGTWIPTNPDMSEGVALVTKDLQGTLVVYDNQGQLIGTVRQGMDIEVNGVTLKVLEVIGSTGLQIKSDPGIPVVYTGFGLLMIAVVMSYFSHSQIWALQSGDNFYVGGKTNRAQVTFEQEVLKILDQVQEDTPSPGELPTLT